MCRKLSLKNINRFLLGVFILAISVSDVIAQGTWTPVASLAPHYNGGVMMLLTDGSVIVKTYYGGFGGTPGTTWDKLTPDSTGSYANGTWSSITPMNNDRLYFSSWVLNDGRVYVGGGEYGAGTQAEIYDPQTNAWAALTTPGANFDDGASEILPGNKLLLAQVSPSPVANYIYDPTTNSYTAAGTSTGSHDEASWLKLPDGSVLQVDLFSTNSERYIPATNSWVADATVPVALYDSHDFETGAAIMLPDGRGFFLGGTGHTAYYTPSGTTSPGTWAAGPDIPGSLVAVDAPVAMMNNGKLLIAVGPQPSYGGDYPAPTSFYEFDYIANTYTSVSAPGGGTTLPVPSYTTNMLDLPDGSVLFVPQGNKQYYLYSPGGSPITAAKPTIDNIYRVDCNTFAVTGKLFTGLSEGAAYGDDWAMATNFPIVRISGGSRTYYARAFNWNRAGSINTGTLEDSVQFEVPVGLTGGSYTLQIVVNGNASDASSFSPTSGVSASSSSLCPGSSITLTAPSGGTWSSSNTGVATVGSSSGIVTGVTAGTATISYSSGSCYYTAPVTVNALASIAATAGANGSVAPSGTTNLCAGESQTYTITPGTGYYIASVVVDGSSVGAGGTYSFSSVTGGSHTISATFTATTYTITASSGSNGSISSAGATSVGYGGSKTYTMTPATGYHVSGVVVDGAGVGAVTSYTFSSVSANHTISVSYAINTYSITASSSPHGATTPAGTTIVNYGGSQVYNFTADMGYYIAAVVIDGASAGAIASFTFSSVSASHTVYVDYEINQYAINSWSDGNSVISPDGMMMVNYGDNQTYTMAANTGYHITDVEVDGVSMGALTSYTFSSIADDHFLSVSADINTYNITATAAAHGTVSPAGTTAVDYGNSLSYTITPNAGYSISNVYVDGVSVGSGSSYSFTAVNAGHSISATFAANTYSITASAGANGTISPAGAATVTYGGSQSYSIVPASGYHIAGVTVDGSSVGAVSAYAFTSVSANHSISASFAINTYTITATAGSNGSVSPSGGTVITSGGSQAYTIAASSGYHVNDVTVDGGSVGAVTSYTFGSVSANHTISASFAVNTYSLTATAGANGTISPPGTTTVTAGGTQAYSIAANTGYHIAGVTVDGASVGAVLGYTFSAVSASHTISASFAINSYSITATAGANGSISSPGTSTVTYGGSKTYTMSPASGYHVSNVVVDGASVGAVTSYTFTSVSASHTISVAFSNVSYKITSSSGAHGSISPNGSTTVPAGTNQSYTFTPGTGYHISNVTVDGSSIGAITSYTFSSVSANHTISVSFAVGARSSQTGAGNEESVVIRSYPNPSDGVFYIVIPASVSAAEVSVTDIAGKTILRRAIVDNTGEPVELSIKPAASGVYLLQVIGGDDVYATKLVVH